MTATMPTKEQTWREDNWRYLQAEMARLRLLLHRRILWLREEWNEDPLQQHHGLVISDAKIDRLLAGGDRRRETEFYRTNKHAASIGQTLTEMDRELARQRDAMESLGPAPAIEVMVRLFQLSPFEREVVLMCLAPEMDSAFEWLYGYIQDDVTRRHLTPELALALQDTETLHVHWERLKPSAALRHYRLVSLEAASSQQALFASRALRLDERLIDYLTGTNRLDERAQSILLPISSGLLTPDRAALADRLAGRMRTQAQAGAWPVMNLTGPADSGRSALARAICERERMGLFRLSPSYFAYSARDQQELGRLLDREAVLSQFAIYIDAGDAGDPAGTSTKPALEEFLLHSKAFVIVASVDPIVSGRKTLALALSRPDVSMKRLLWRDALRGVPNTVEDTLDQLVHQFEFGPASIELATAKAVDRARLRAEEGPWLVTRDDLWHSSREQAGKRLGELAECISPCHNWDDIVLPLDVYEQLREIAGQVECRSQVYEQWGFGEKLSRGRGINALFAGPSGTGKTMAAEVLANQLQLNLYRIDLSGVVSKYIGETEKNLRKLFDAAEQCGAVLFFDEADALFGKRSEVKDSHDRYANIEINYLLQRMEEYRGMAIMATNRKSYIDDAFMRRLRFLVDFPSPGLRERIRIWERVFPCAAALDCVDFNALGRMEIPGGNIKNIAVNAAFLAANDGGRIRMDHVIRAARREYAKIERLPMESEFGSHYAVVRQ
jgi:hypothetical protein